MLLNGLVTIFVLCRHSVDYKTVTYENNDIFS